MNTCALCRYTGGDKEDINFALSYIVDSMGTVDEDEIARQVVQLLSDNKKPEDTVIDVSHADVKRHIHEHMLEQRVVMVNVLKDLLSVNRSAKALALCDGVACADNTEDPLSPVQDDDMSVAESEMKVSASGHKIMDAKAMAVYLKTIDQITGIYKMPSMLRLNASGTK